MAGRAIKVTVAMLVALLVSACGSGVRTGRVKDAATARKHGPPVVDIYVSLPLRGPGRGAGTAIQQGVKVGFNEVEAPRGHIGLFRVRISYLNDANAHGWSVTQTFNNARRAARDPLAAIYIGELDSGATEISLPILNQAGIIEVTPLSSFAGLTDKLPTVIPAADDEPQRFYPDARLHNLLRLAPNNLVQLAAILDAFKAKRFGDCTRLTALSFGGGPGSQIAVAGAAATARLYGIKFLATKVPPMTKRTTITELASYIETLRAQQVGCLLLAGQPSGRAVTLMHLIRVDMPSLGVIGTAGYCHNRPAIPFLYCVSPVLPLNTYSNWQLYAGRYRHVLGVRGQPPASSVFGYVAAEIAGALLLDVPSASQDIRAQLQEVLRTGSFFTDSLLLGDVYFNTSGDINQRHVGLYQQQAKGALRFDAVISPPRWL
ncbi:MAG: ABC transporter substrate-binding protein [Solirubrobacteraceae bacterium]